MKYLSLGLRNFAARTDSRTFGAAESGPSQIPGLGVQHHLRLYGTRRLFSLASGAIALLWMTGSIAADEFAASTDLLDVRQGSTRSNVVKEVSRGGYELADGTPVDFSDWYSSIWTDLEVDFLTEVSGNLGLIWGISTGERGEKYRISPGLKVGFVYSLAPTPDSTLSLSASTRFGSFLREEHCTANYGEIGGIQPVNCRLAASMLESAETLKHDLRLDGFGDTKIAVAFELRF